LIPLLDGALRESWAWRIVAASLLGDFSDGGFASADRMQKPAL
jgi:hypothetical protein